MTKRLIQAIWDCTSRCYCYALKEEYPDAFKDVKDIELKSQNFDKLMRAELTLRNLPHRSPTIHEKYLRHIKTDLTNEELGLIVEANEKGKIKRDGTTIHACVDELFERGANINNKGSK